MSIPINQVHINFYRDWLKEQAGGTLRPDDFSSLVETAMFEMFDAYVDEWQKKQIITDKIGYWLEQSDPDIQVINGFYKAPLNYLYYVDAYTLAYQTEDCSDDPNVGINPITDLPADQYNRRVSSVLLPPSRDHAISKRLGSTDTFPQGRWEVNAGKDVIQYVRLNYIRRPKSPIWAYVPQNNRPVFDAANSVDVDMPYSCLNELVARMISLQSITAREASVQQGQQMHEAQDQGYRREAQ